MRRRVFGNFLKDRLFSYHSFRSVHYINGNHPDPQAECERYAQLLTALPTDIVLLGIGENTHLAFNDPHVAFFNDPEIVKVVDLDAACRYQQVNDGCFPTLEEVPTHAITITIPPLIRSTYAYAIVPGAAKAQAIFHTLTEAVQENYPSTKLREHDHAILFIDIDNSASNCHEDTYYHKPLLCEACFVLPCFLADSCARKRTSSPFARP